MDWKDYQTLKDNYGSRVAEVASRVGELEIQARFYAGEFGLAWTGADGEMIEAIHLGEWNREPGPDFVRAKLRIDGVEKSGDIELDPEDADWERHGHATNPAFDHVILHVFLRSSRRRFFTRNSRNHLIAQVGLKPVSPQDRRNRPPPSSAGTVAQEEAVALVDAAARFRLGRKREAWLRSEALHGRDEAIFQGLAVGLGYKNNKVPFLLVSQRTTLARARKSDGEALLFGIAGFLDSRPFDEAGQPARQYLRDLWERWWKMRDREARLVLPSTAWTVAATRPQNHPHRRLAALAAAARRMPGIIAGVRAADAAAFLGILEGLEHEFFDSHASLTSAPFAHPCALVGHQRAVELAANLLAPAAGLEAGMEILRALRAGTPSSRAVKSAAWLGLTGEASRQLLATALGQQGLIQLYDDFFPAPAGDLFAAIASGGAGR
ncbi:MAG: hypothetical protein Fur0032_06550 [Terrimicrobiaceae bacterium]